MTRQKSEKGVVPKDLRKLVPTGVFESPRGGKALPVNKESWQLGLPFATAENHRTDAKAERGQPPSAANAAPKARVKDGRATSATMESVVERLGSAFARVEANKGAPGPDHQSITMVREHLGEVLRRVASLLSTGGYQPGEVRRVWIPKPGGGQRGLGIPNVVDRVVQEAVRQVLEPLYEPGFHPSSHGFRPGRSCHTAIAEAQEYLEEGSEYVVDLDLEKFFDQVCHQRLLARLDGRIEDKRLLVLIRKMLKANVVLPDGVVVSTDTGVPQGGPLSPLLSNIVLDELDWELDQRGLHFVRYADDCNIYVRSERAGHRVMASVSRFIEKRLRLKVNSEKSAVARPEERHFLGFSLCVKPFYGEVDVRLSERTKKRAAAKLSELTPRNWGSSLATCIERANKYLTGWFNFFGVCSSTQTGLLSNFDAHLRRRLRALILKQWKRKRTRARKLIALGAKRKTAWRTLYDGRRATWDLSRTSAVERALSNAYFAKLGLTSLYDLWMKKHRPIVAPVKQLSLPLG